MTALLLALGAAPAWAEGAPPAMPAPTASAAQSPAAQAAPAPSAEAPVAVSPKTEADLASDPQTFEARRGKALDDLRAWFLDQTGKLAEPKLIFSAADELTYPRPIAELRGLSAQAALIRDGRAEGWDDWQSYSDMAVLVAARLGVRPPEAALPVFKDRERLATDPLTPAEEAVRADLAADIRSPDFTRRYLYIDDLMGLPGPDPRLTSITQSVLVRIRRGRKRVRRLVKRKLELAPPPKPVSVIDQVDWDKADALADVADENAHGWDRKPKESLRRYRRRLRQLRKHCYASVRRDLAALGFWDAQIFRGDVPPTRYDRMRPIRAASFALAMAKVEAAQDKNDPMADKTTLRQLNLRIDPLVRGSIVVFSQSVCGYDARNGHIEIITSLDPLRAASYKFHNVTTECLVRASNENKVHVYVPLRLDPQRRASAAPVSEPVASRS